MTELIWEGKYDRDGRKVAPVRVALPLGASTRSGCRPPPHLAPHFALPSPPGLSPDRHRSASAADIP